MSTSRLVGVLLAACALGVGACGSSDSTSTTNASASQGAGGQRNGPGAVLRDPKVQACLKKQGVTIPSFRRPPGSGQRPPGGSGQGGGQSGGSGGQRPPGGGANGGRFAQRFQQLRAALQKCGVQLPQGGGRPPQPQGQGTSTTTQT